MRSQSFVLFAAVTLLGCSGGPPDGYVRVSSSTASAAEQLAILEQGRQGERDVPAATVQAFDSTLRSLEQTCRQQRDGREGRPGLADVTVAAVQDVRKNGGTLGYLEFLKAIESSIPAEMPRPVDCVEIAAILATMIRK